MEGNKGKVRTRIGPMVPCRHKDWERIGPHWYCMCCGEAEETLRAWDEAVREAVRSQAARKGGSMTR